MICAFLCLIYEILFYPMSQKFPVHSFQFWNVVFYSDLELFLCMTLESTFIFYHLDVQLSQFHTLNLFTTACTTLPYTCRHAPWLALSMVRLSALLQLYSLLLTLGLQVWVFKVLSLAYFGYIRLFTLKNLFQECGSLVLPLLELLSWFIDIVWELALYDTEPSHPLTLYSCVYLLCFKCLSIEFHNLCHTFYLHMLVWCIPKSPIVCITIISIFFIIVSCRCWCVGILFVFVYLAKLWWIFMVYL